MDLACAERVDYGDRNRKNYPSRRYQQFWGEAVDIMAIYGKNNSSVLTKSKSRELIALDGELCDFKDGEANSFRIWLEMKESGENLLGYMVKSGIEGLEKKNGIGENEISQGTL